MADPKPSSAAVGYILGFVAQIPPMAYITITGTVPTWARIWTAAWLLLWLVGTVAKAGANQAKR